MSEMVKSEQAKEDSFRLVIVTGMSGGGKTQASRYLEDLGYFCVDNLPPVFIPKFVELCKHSGGHVRKVVLVVDTRSREFFDTFVHTLNDMDKDDVPYEMLFMDASDPAIIRRYKETRRRHPLAPSSRISEGIAKERERLAPVRAKATYIIDTSELRKVDLRDKIHRLFGTSGGEQMSINVLSFGFKFGMPLDAIIAMGTAVNASITSLSTLVLFAVVPFNIVKGVLVSILTMLLYKRVEKVFFRRRKST